MYAPVRYSHPHHGGHHGRVFSRVHRSRSRSRSRSRPRPHHHHHHHHPLANRAKTNNTKPSSIGSGSTKPNNTKHRMVQTDRMYVEHHPSVSSALNNALPYIKEYLRRERPAHPTVIFDLDETLLKYIGDEDSDFARTFPGMRSFMEELRALGVHVVYITARRERGRRETERTMRELKLWREGDVLMMKPNDFPSHASSVAKRQQRDSVVRAGRAIVANVGDQMSDMLPKREWKRFIHDVLDLPDCALRRAVDQAARQSDSVSKIIEDSLTKLSHTLLFVKLEPDVVISVKMPSNFTTH